MKDEDRETARAAFAVIDYALRFVRRRRFARRSDAVLKEYERLAPVYDRRWSRYLAATVEHCSGRLAESDCRYVLDVGCGTGTFLSSLPVRLPEARLAGIDLSRPMLSVARAKLPPTTVLCRARAEALPFDDERFDLAVSLSAFHDFDEPAQAMRELFRVLRPEGAVLVTDWCGDYLTSKLLGHLAKLRRGAGFSVPNSQGWYDLLECAGFRGIGVERYRAGWLWGLMTAAAVKPSGAARIGAPACSADGGG